MKNNFFQKSNTGRKYLLYSIIAIAGFILGALIFHSPHAVTEKNTTAVNAADTAIWTCAMHPQIRMHEPGKCPICGMDLIPLRHSDIKTDADAIHFSPEAAALAQVMTSKVIRQNAVTKARLYGKIQGDERLVQSQVATIPGRIEKLYVNFTGETVERGQPLVRIYSPDLVTAQQELLEAARTRQAMPQIYEAAREKLRQWKLTDKQIESIEKSGSASENFDIEATTSGIVTSRLVNTGQYVAQGTVLYNVADLSKVWVLFDAYESDLHVLSRGNKIDFTVQALPGQSFSGSIAFIDPVINPATRVASVRVELNNQGRLLKPGMFVTGEVSAGSGAKGDNIVIPRSAVLWTGKRSIVYVRQPGSAEPVFKMREIELGQSLGESYIVLSGLREDEEIVTNGTFSVDAAAQLEGKPSMMNSKSGSDPELSSSSFKASGNCEMCKDRIEKAARSVAGVTSAIWDQRTKLLSVEYDRAQTDVPAIEKAVAKAGHDTELFKADDVTYKSLPECCHYRN